MNSHLRLLWILVLAASAACVPAGGPDGDPGTYGGLFWLNRGGDMEGVPADAFWSAGFMGQTTMVIPSRDAVIARLGPSPGGSDAYFSELVRRLLESLPQG